jgi:RNA polymerase sigma-70 factor, ECF subfamily
MRDTHRNTSTEAEIQELITKGAFDKAYVAIDKAYRGEIVAYCDGWLSGYPGADGEGVAQEILDKFYQELQSYDPFIATVYTLLSAIKRNRVIDEIRRLTRRQQNRAAAVSELQHRAWEMEQANDPERVLFENQRKELVENAIEELPEIDRVLFRSYLDGRSSADLAPIFGISEGAIRVRKNRIQQKIREKINRDTFSFRTSRLGRFSFCIRESHWDEILRLAITKKLFTIELNSRPDYPDVVVIEIHMDCEWCQSELFGLFGRIEEHW